MSACQIILKTVISVLAIAWFATAQASSAAHFHFYVTATIDGEVVSQHAIASRSGLTARFEVPGNLYAELTSRDTDASSYEVQVTLYAFEGGPLIGGATFAIHESHYSALIECPLKSAQQLRLQLRGHRFQLLRAIEGM